MSGYYVSAIDGKRVALLAGPFRSREAALGRLPQMEGITTAAVGAGAHWYRYGTLRKDGTLPAGKLNQFLGLSPA